MSEEEDEVEISDSLEHLAEYAFDEARQKFDDSGIFEPFTILSDGENIYIETHPGENVEECFESAKATVRSAEEAITSYVFCYDGYVDLDEGTKDAIIVEAAEKTNQPAYAICWIYENNDGIFSYEPSPAYLGDTPSYFEVTDLPMGVEAIPEAIDNPAVKPADDEA